MFSSKNLIADLAILKVNICILCIRIFFFWKCECNVFCNLPKVFFRKSNSWRHLCRCQEFAWAINSIFKIDFIDYFTAIRNVMLFPNVSKEGNFLLSSIVQRDWKIVFHVTDYFVHLISLKAVKSFIQCACTINSKLNGTPKGYLLISKLHSILAVANLLAHNNVTFSYCLFAIECCFEMGK